MLNKSILSASRFVADAVMTSHTITAVNIPRVRPSVIKQVVYSACKRIFETFQLSSLNGKYLLLELIDYIIKVFISLNWPVKFLIHCTLIRKGGVNQMYSCSSCIFEQDRDATLSIEISLNETYTILIFICGVCI
ncbi:hypothetical protein GJ496_011867 [Pomphorhynchus laevis]|nr:hypothetical protein GJ496_011867 [Pomphorhynchus laevis]